jgi:hypothetical protein
MWLALRPLDDSDEFWREELRAAALEAAVACAPVIVAGAFELYIARERERMKLERERIKAALQHINESGEE